MNVLILGANGFMGNALSEKILATTDWHVYGMDLSTNKIQGLLPNARFHFVEGDISIHREWVEYHVKKCDVILPLVAIATPASYVRDPLGVFELDFEENLRVIRLCQRYKKRLLFPSTSEVYGMCRDAEFSEETSNFVYGPIHKSRWIYACSKQLLDRVIAAMGQTQGLRFTCFRPFNWIGPKLDDIYAPKEGSSRVVTQFIVSLLDGEPIRVVDGGHQRRCYTWIEDGIDGLMRIIRGDDEACNGEIFNLGNPDNECSVRELADKLAQLYAKSYRHLPGYREPRIEEVSATEFYGKGYEDIMTRTPSIAKARTALGWNPRVSLDEALARTLDHFVRERQEIEGATTGSSPSNDTLRKVSSAH
ncbi:MAG: bifunctional UDP-4-keto-pentose/UDP-xylose synthase [Acidobacteria bacterium]|nr:bifunctional UDP-4-keto-pentose/UDP-xylose synthase [Acidobacteriota bacterium]